MHWYHRQEILGYILALKDTGYTWDEVFNKIVLEFPNEKFTTSDSLRKRYNEHKNKIEAISTQDIAYHTYDEAYKALCEYIKKTKKVVPAKSRGYKSRKKILLLSDPHIPFHNINLMKQVVSQHQDADMLIIPGDFLDCYSVSRFSKSKNIPLKEELTQATSILDWLVTVFPEIIILEGNHTERVRKHFEARISQELMFLVQFDVLKLIASPYKSVEVVNDNYVFPNGNGDIDVGYFKLIGKDFIVGHFERSSIIPIRAIQNSFNWIKSWAVHFGIKDQIRLFLNGHTHRLSKYPIDSGETVIGETGTVAQIQDYAVDGSAKYSAHLNGYWIVFQDNGVTDLNASNFFIL